MIFAPFLFFIASIIFTFPISINMNSIISGFGAGDGFLSIWNAYIFWHQLLSDKNPFFTEMIFYPYGANLAFHDYSPLTNLLLGIFRNNLVVGMNVIILLTFTMAAFSTFLLIKLVTKNYLLSILAGLIYAFSPIMFSYLLTEHYYYLFAAPYLPLGIFIAMKFLQKKEIRYFFLLIIIFWLLFFTSYYMLVVNVVVMMSFFFTKTLAYVYRKENLHFLKQLRILSILLIIFIILPIVYLFLFVFNIKDFQKYNISGSIVANTCNADLLGYIIPNQAVTDLRNISLQLSESLGYQPRGDVPSYYIGLFYLTLAVIAFVKFRNNSDIQAIGVVGTVILLLSLGTRIQIGGLILFQGIFTPFHWFSKLPFIGFINCPIRFPIVVLLSVILLSFFLINEVIKKYKLSTIFNCILLLLFFFIEYGIPKIQLSSTDIPKVYQLIAQADNQLTVLELPSGLTEGYGNFGFDYSIPELNGMQMYWQTVYKKPRIGGYISRIPKTIYQFFREELIISDIFKMTNYSSVPIEKKYGKRELDEFIRKFNIGYIIFSPNRRQNEYLQATENLLRDINYQKIYSEGFILLSLY